MQKIFMAALLACCSSLAWAGNLQGQLSFTGADPNAEPPVYKDTVIFFRPAAALPVKPMVGDFTMAMSDKSFVPHVLPVTVGTAVRFPNQDPIFHNAFSPSTPDGFDLGLYDTGGGKTQVFAHPGLVHVYCNVHRDMFAYILVLDTPYFAVAKDDGSFQLNNLPDVAGDLIIWNPRTKVWQQHTVVAGSQPRLAVALTVVFNGVPDHVNKDGKAYFHHRLPGG